MKSYPEHRPCKCARRPLTKKSQKPFPTIMGSVFKGLFLLLSFQQGQIPQRVSDALPAIWLGYHPDGSFWRRPSQSWGIRHAVSGEGRERHHKWRGWRGDRQPLRCGAGKAAGSRGLHVKNDGRGNRGEVNEGLVMVSGPGIRWVDVFCWAQLIRKSTSRDQGTLETKSAEWARQRWLGWAR